MALDAYASCPCGSGKKFKWCCQPIHVEIDKAFQMDEAGQHEAALIAMEQVTKAHEGNPEAWGRKAELLYNAGKTEEAEAALQKAFDVSPTYAFGHLLRGSFRRAEGEIPGALIMFRKAAEYYDPEAQAILAQIHTLIFDCEMKLNHPIAAHAAAHLAVRFNPSAEELRQGIESVFGDKNPNLPLAARQDYKYLPASPILAPERRAAWTSALERATTGKLTDAVQAFEQLARADADDAPAQYNLALSYAWLGNNLAAVEALDKYVALETDEARAADAWKLAEVLRLGQGMEDQADWVEYSIITPLQDPQGFVNVLGELEKDNLLTGARVNQEEGVLTAVLIEQPGPALTPELEAKQNARLAAYVMLMGNVLRIWNINKESLDKIYQTLRQRAGQTMAAPYETRGPAKFFDVTSECLIFPRGATTEAALHESLRAHMQTFFEETWVHRPLKSLGNVPPIDAAGHPKLRKKLLGTIAFLEECAGLTKFPYDFNRLRRKLNMAEGKAAATSAAEGAAPADALSAEAVTESASLDISAMAVPELSGLATDTLTDAQLDDAYVAAQKLDARDLAGKFAEALVGRPSRADKPDRYPFFNHLVNLALAQGDTSSALDHINAGEKDDCEHNQGHRRNDYELRRGQVLAKSGDFGQAGDVFDRLIARVPQELKVRGSAAEAMLSAKQGKRAAAYAEAGLAEARKQNHRDSEQYFLELAEAAKKQGG